MKWINPDDQHKRIIHRCEFCNADVSTPYKGVHNEMEFINGFPSPCRNNGRMNMHIEHGYRFESNPPKEGHKWFVEHSETHEWYTGYGWTRDPHQAFGCDLERTADRFARLEGLKDYVITEHIFC